MTNLSFIDSHAHITMSPIWENVDAIIARAKQASVSDIINICINKDALEKGFLLKNKYSCIYNVGATSPHDIAKEGERYFSYFEDHALKKNICAIGEIGLDYYYQHSPKSLQKEFLRRYFNLAMQSHLPVVIHCRDAFSDLFDIADKYYKNKNGYGPCVLHCFTGNEDEAKEAIKRGWLISFSGIITFKKSFLLRKVLPIVPINQLLIETDSPFLAPEGYRGKTNEPSYVVEIAKTIAHLYDMPIEKIASSTSSNAKLFFSIT